MRLHRVINRTGIYCVPAQGPAPLKHTFLDRLRQKAYHNYTSHSSFLHDILLYLHLQEAPIHQTKHFTFKSVHDFTLGTTIFVRMRTTKYTYLPPILTKTLIIVTSTLLCFCAQLLFTSMSTQTCDHIAGL